MTNQRQPDSEKSKDTRTATTSKIWSYATGMLALCIPLSAVTRSGAILPLAVVTGATISTAVVWKSDKKAQNLLQPHQMQQIEERLANLETIAASDPLQWQSQRQQLESSDRHVSDS
ncbi:MAG: hypothetical protein F6K36_27360 [Symploca sp. SIO3C6]|uniref:Uncharacterized protein n=1 Tax=Symploca sp. SIO1C4 TaxID=2607765 RepID=A0A6B3NB48_9CYAN|nr:hypothetical protein [Symploca sp. SIO3C6]NER28810.1 hypothetical protein [Symploca sp. SIO1C4]NET08490.1 hypothetical protein [Symploca sp. SIO2B6]